MKLLPAAGLAVVLLAAAGCSSEQERQEAAGGAVKAAFASAGLSKVTWQSVTGDGYGRIDFNGLAAQAGDTAVGIKQLSFEEPDLDPMLVKWHDIGKIEVREHVLYGGYAPKPKGFKARRMTAAGVTVGAVGGLKATAGSFSVEGFDSTRPGDLRYAGYAMADASLSWGGKDAVKLDSLRLSADKWAEGLPSPLRSKAEAKGRVFLDAFGPYGILPLARPEVAFAASGDADFDLATGKLEMNGSLETDGLGKLSGKLVAGGVDRKLLELLSAPTKAKEPPAAVAKPAPPKPGKGKQAVQQPTPKEVPADPQPTQVQALMDASASVSLVSFSLSGSGLEWLGAAFDESFGSREALANLALPFVDRGFAGPEKSDAANAALAGIMLFVNEPGSFTLTLQPPEPFVFGAKGMKYYLDPASGPLDALGFGFENGTGKEGSE